MAQIYTDEPMTPEEKAALTDKNLPPMTPADEAREQYQRDDAAQLNGLEWLAGELDKAESMADEAKAMLIQAAEVTELVVKARKNLLTVTLNLNAAKASYEDAKRDAYLMGAVSGKNAEEREARLASILEVQTNNVRAAEREYLTARTELECAEDVIRLQNRADRIAALALGQVNI